MPAEKKHSSMEPIDGATATAHVAYQLTDIALIFPITPSSPMTEAYSAWSSAGKPNLFGQVPMVKQMQSEGGSAGALHGAASEGAVATTFTSSQGLLLMIPNIYKLAGELIPAVIHIAARTIATEALSIFGDHSDIYSVRSTGLAFLFATSVQEALHMGIAAHVATLKSLVPFASVQDGFRTTHEIQKCDYPTQEQIARCVDFDAIARHRARGLNPTHPVLRGTAQNPDVFFQASMASQPYYDRTAAVTEEVLATVNGVFGTKYSLFEYYGDANATDVIVSMGSSIEIIKSVIDALHKMPGSRKLGCINVRLYRPFSAAHLARALPATCTHICVLDRAKDPQSTHEPLFLDVCAALTQTGRKVNVMIGGVYGLSSKDFTPEMVAAVFDNLASSKPVDRFTVGIIDDVNKNSLTIPYGKLPSDTVLPAGTRQCLLWGIGGDGTIGANKTAIKLIADSTDLHAQGYFSYDANKSGGLTISHLRFGPTRFEAPYLVGEADYVACHTTAYIHRFELANSLKKGGIFLLNCPWRTMEEFDQHLPKRLRRKLAEREAAFYAIDATKIAREAGVGSYINMVLQAVFFALSGVVEFNKAISVLKESVVKLYHRKGQAIIDKNIKAIDMSCDPSLLVRVPYQRDAWMALPAEELKKKGLLRITNPKLDQFNKDIYDPIGRFEGDSIPVSKFAPGGEMITGTSQLGKRGIADKVPHWHGDKCIQCNQCSFVCPHAVIRSYQINEAEMAKAPKTLDTIKSRKPGHQFRIGVSALDCTGCAVCAETCPVKCLEMKPLEPEYEANAENIAFLRDQVVPKPELGDKKNVLGLGAQPPYFEFPGSCGGCGETPLLRLTSQLFGDRMVIAAATGCNSIYSASYPTVPYCTNEKGEGPAWHNSLFEDGAELGYGMIAAYRQRRELLVLRIEALLKEPIEAVKGMTPELRAALEEWLKDRMDFDKTKLLGYKIKPMLLAAAADSNADKRIHEIAHPQFTDLLPRTSFWCVGGDGWAYDIGFGGLDHVIANNEDINILVLDTEVYSNTGGQRSKSTPLGAQAKFAASGKDTPKKDLGRIAMQYEHAYVASIAQGADMQQTINALKEAEAYPGPSIVIAYTPCTEHHLTAGMKDCMKVQKLAVETGYWLLYRFNPLLASQGKNPFMLDCKPPSKKPAEYLKTQGRYVSMQQEFPERSKQFEAALEAQITQRFVRYQRMVQMYEPMNAATDAAAPAAAAAAVAKPEPVAAPAVKASRLLVLYASASGNSEAAAHFLGQEAGKLGIAATVTAMDDFDFAGKLAAEPLIAICCSSSDSIPENGQKFFAWLTSPERAAQKTLSKVSYAFFGLGDSRFTEYLRIPKQVEAALKAAGATPILASGDGDENHGGFMKGLTQWTPAALKVVRPLVDGVTKQEPQPTKPQFKPEETEDSATTSKAVAPGRPTPAPAVSPSLGEEKALEAAAKVRSKKAKLVEVCPDVYWVGAVDWNVRDFHGIATLKGSSYNSFLILGPTPTLIDTVKAPFADVLLANIRSVIDPALIKYVVVNHAEPDHSSALGKVLAACPNAEVVCTSRCRDALIRNFKGLEPIHGFNTGGVHHDFAAHTNHSTSHEANASNWKYHIVKSQEKLSLGPTQTLFFFETPMMHWPESTFTYLIEQRVLFCMDAFGQHIGSVARFDDEILTGFTSTGIAPTINDLIESARSYYANILMPFGKAILSALDKFMEAVSKVETVHDEHHPLPRVLATAHGIMWRSHTDKIVSLYRRWASHTTLPKVLVMYDTMYGTTERMARAIFQGATEYIDEKDGRRAQALIMNAKEEHYTRTADEVLDSAVIAIGSPSLNNGVLPSLGDHMVFLKGLHPENRAGLAFGSYGWGPTATNTISKWFEDCNITQAAEAISVQFSADEAVLRKCYEAGRDLARLALSKGTPF